MKEMFCDKNISFDNYNVDQNKISQENKKLLTGQRKVFINVGLTQEKLPLTSIIPGISFFMKENRWMQKNGNVTVL